MPAVRVMSSSRAVPVDLGTAFQKTIAVPLPTIFHRWYGPLAPVSEVRDQDGVWATVGQTRVVVQAGGSGTLRETLTRVEAPRSFGYHLDDAHGPVAGLIAAVDGEWRFAPAGTGTEITWQWSVTPTAVSAPLMPMVERLWRGFARQALEELARVLLTA